MNVFFGESFVSLNSGICFSLSSSVLSDQVNLNFSSQFFCSYYKIHICIDVNNELICHCYVRLFYVFFFFVTFFLCLHANKTEFHESVKKISIEDFLLDFFYLSNNTHIRNELFTVSLLRKQRLCSKRSSRID